MFNILFLPLVNTKPIDEGFNDIHINEIEFTPIIEKYHFNINNFEVISARLYGLKVITKTTSVIKVVE